jgi:hypothetical protein
MTRVGLAVVLAESHGPARNPWWVNAILVIVIAAALVFWRVRVRRRRRGTDPERVRPGGRS